MHVILRGGEFFCDLAVASFPIGWKAAGGTAADRSKQRENAPQRRRRLHPLVWPPHNSQLTAPFGGRAANVGVDVAAADPRVRHEERRVAADEEDR
jgi:hypothetical protein